MTVLQTETGNQKAHDCFTNWTGNQKAYDCFKRKQATKKHMTVLQTETGNQTMILLP